MAFHAVTGRFNAICGDLAIRDIFSARAVGKTQTKRVTEGQAKHSSYILKLRAVRDDKVKSPKLEASERGYS